MSNDTLIILQFIIINFCTGTIFGLMDSRNFWRKKWEEVIKDEKNIIR